MRGRRSGESRRVGRTERAAAAASGTTALGEGDPEKVLSLYSDDTVLWGTLSPMVRADRAALKDYFIGAFKELPGLNVTFGDQLIRVYGTTAVNTGYYTLRLRVALSYPPEVLEPIRRRRPVDGRDGDRPITKQKHQRLPGRGAGQPKRP